MSDVMVADRNVWFSANINQNTENTFTSFIINSAVAGAQSFDVYLTTRGGDPYCGMNLHQFIRSRKEKFRVFNMSSVDSAGVLFYLGFAERYAVHGSTFLLHECTFTNQLPPNFNYAQVATVASQLRALNVTVGEMISNATSNNYQRVEEILAISTVLTAEQGVEFGMVHEVRAATIPAVNTFFVN